MQAGRSQILNSLIQRADFVALNRKGRKYSSHGLVLQALPNEQGIIRVGYTVTKKTEISAVKRNRIKRRLRAAASDVLPEWALDSHDYVLIGKQTTAIRPYHSLCMDLKGCLEKIGCLKNS